MVMPRQKTIIILPYRMKTAKRNLLRKTRADLEANPAQRVRHRSEAGRQEVVLWMGKGNDRLQEVRLRRKTVLNPPKNAGLRRQRVLKKENAVKAPRKRAKSQKVNDLEAGRRNDRVLRSESDDQRAGPIVVQKNPTAKIGRKDREADLEVGHPAMLRKPNWTLLKKALMVKVAKILLQKNTPSLTEKARGIGLAAGHPTETTTKKTGQLLMTAEMTKATKILTMAIKSS